MSKSKSTGEVEETTEERLTKLLDEVEKELKMVRAQIKKERKTLFWQRFVEIRDLLGRVYVKLFHVTRLAHTSNPNLPKSEPKHPAKGKLF